MEKKDAFSVLVGRPEGQRSLGRPRHKLKDNIKTDLKQAKNGMELVHLSQDKDQCRGLANTKMNLKVP
jgi:hypothetical protein